VDLKPREVAGPTPSGKPKRTWGPILVLVLVIAGGGVVVGKFLTSAIDYYCNADEIGAKSSCSGDRRVRVQGTVDQHSIVKGANGGIDHFTISFNGATVPVDYSEGAALPSLFQSCIPVVVEGRMVSGTLEGTNVEVKHSEKYEAENPNRIASAESAGDACSQQA